MSASDEQTVFRARDISGMVRDITRAAYTKRVAAIGREPKPMTANYEQAGYEALTVQEVILFQNVPTCVRPLARGRAAHSGSAWPRRSLNELLGSEVGFDDTRKRSGIAC
jgi:hypothetical protein